MLAGGASVRAVARHLGIAPTSVQRHARRLGAWRPEWLDRPKLQSRGEERPRILLERHRAAWLLYRQGPHLTAKDLPVAAFNAYRYLLAHDREWLAENAPLGRSRTGA